MRAGIHDFWIKDTQSPARYNELCQQYAEAAYKLYTRLIAPVEEELPEQLVIIPDDVLGYLPFDALLSQMPEGPANSHTYEYLLKKYQISYAYSAALLLDMQKKRHRASKHLLAMAPSFQGTPVEGRDITGDPASPGSVTIQYS